MAKTSKKEFVLLNDKKIELSAVSFEKLVQAMFLLVPYVKLIKTIKSEINNTSTELALFYDIIQNLVDQLDKNHLADLLSIFTGISVDDAKMVPAVDVIRALPVIIYINDLYIVYNLFRQLEAFE